MYFKELNITDEIEISDVIKVATDLKKDLTTLQILSILEKYDDEASVDKSSNWCEIVENLIYNELLND